MFIVAGPPGAGKSTAFPVSGFGVDFFNADDRAAALNDGSYLNVPRNVRSHVNTLFESFVLDHIARRSSCAFVPIPQCSQPPNRPFAALLFAPETPRLGRPPCPLMMVYTEMPVVRCF